MTIGINPQSLGCLSRGDDGTRRDESHRPAWWLGGTALATDGSYLYFTWQDETGDLWTMDVANTKQQ